MDSFRYEYKYGRLRIQIHIVVHSLSSIFLELYVDICCAYVKFYEFLRLFAYN